MITMNSQSDIIINGYEQVKMVATIVINKLFSKSASCMLIGVNDGGLKVSMPG